MNTTDDIELNGSAGRRAETGTSGWEDAVRLQRWAAPDHADFYVLGGEIVSTLYALEDLARVLARQVDGYADTQAQRRRVVYDDTRKKDPRRRLVEAVAELDVLVDHLWRAERAANAFWSQIGHVGTELAPCTDDADEVNR
jgi:hypothetical protein